MDPKTLASLDPKLRETYERVMGTSPVAGATPSQPTDATAAAPPAPPAPTPPDNPAVTTDAAAQAPAGQLFSPSAPGAPPIPSAGPAYTPENLGLTQPMPAAQPLPSPNMAMTGSQSTSSLLRILYIIGGIIFFVAYTYFWIKIFKLPLPF